MYTMMISMDLNIDRLRKIEVNGATLTSCLMKPTFKIWKVKTQNTNPIDY